MGQHELWSFNNALIFIVCFILFIIVAVFGIKSITNIQKIKQNWASERCSPMIMPFAGLYGYNIKDNFDFCMGKIFHTHSMPFFGSIGKMFVDFTSLLQHIFNSISSLRNIIASLGGGINVVFQEFTERISMFFFNLRLSAIHIKTLIGRMYAILFSVMYMGMSGITGMTSFTNTFLFSFLNTFCFPGNTHIDVKGKGLTKIKDIEIGDILEPTNSVVTGTFRFYSRGQPMVQLGSTTVSTNHYVIYNNKPIKAGEHPDAIQIGCWDNNEPLYCLDCDNNLIPVGKHIFLDYDETDKGDNKTMSYIENRLNSTHNDINGYRFKEYCPAIYDTTVITTTNGYKEAKDIIIGDLLITGSKVIGLIRRKVTEYCKLDDGTILTPSTLFWNSLENKWQRIGTIYDIINKDIELISFIVVPNSQIELANGIRIRDYMELCSPDSEMYYSECLETSVYFDNEKCK